MSDEWANYDRAAAHEDALADAIAAAAEELKEEAAG